MITITRKGLQLAINDEIIPAQGSSDVPVQFINDEETYQNYLIEPRVGWYKSGCYKSTVARYEGGIIYLPAEVFIKNGQIVIVIALIDPDDGNHIEVTHPVNPMIINAPLGDVILPEKVTWEQAVTTLVKQLNEQIQADVAAAIKKANKASEDAKAALTKSNQTNQTINEKIKDGSFIPQATVGTVEMTQPGTKAEVTITGDKKNPEFNFKIPKDEIDDSEDIKKALLQGTYTTDLSEEYKGVASDYGAEIIKIEGKSEQATTKGYQLFDASKLPTKTQGGATVTNNGDGSFTVSGSGNLSEIFNLGYTLSHEESIKLLSVGRLTLKGVKKTFPYLQVKITSAIGNIYLGYENNNVQITQAHLDDQTMRIGILFYGETGKSIVSERLKPMLYQEGDGAWEQFTGGMPSPNPNYPQEIRNALDEPLVSVSRNLVIDNLKGFIGGGTSDHHITIDNNSETFYFRAKKGQQYSFGADVNLSRKTIGYCFEKPVNGAKIYGFTTSIQKTFIAEYDTYCCIYVSETLNNEIKKSFRVNEGNELLPYEPYKYAETELNFQRMCSLPDGTCDIYENGVSTQRIALHGFNGGNRENWIVEKCDIGNRFIIDLPQIQKAMPSHIRQETSMNSALPLANSGGTWNTKNCYTINNNKLYVSLNGTETLEEFKQYLSNNEMQLLYKLETPIVLEVEKPIVPTFYPYTNIYQVDDVKAKIQYGLRSKVEECPYDIGDLYITLNETLPSVKWKGTKWERVEGLVPVGYKESDADFGTLGKTGGAKTVTLTEEQMPEHNHPAKAKKAGNHDHKLALGTPGSGAASHTGARIKADSWTTSNEGENIRVWQDAAPILDNGEHDHVITVENAGGSQAHNNLQPYQVFNMWLRTK